MLVGLVVSLATVLAAVAVFRIDVRHADDILLWMLVCMVSELFWLRTPNGDAVQSLASTAKLASVVVLEPWSAMLVLASSTIAGNLVFRRAKWYQALYNGSQIMLSGTGAALVYYLLGGPYLQDALALGTAGRGTVVAEVLTSRVFWLAYLVAGPTYILINNALVAWLFSTMRGKRMLALMRENSFYPEEIQSNFALVLLTPLMVLTYGILGIPGLLVLFLCLALVHQANRRYLAVTKAQDNLIRSERMAAMGEMAEEIGQSMGEYLETLKTSAARLYAKAESLDEDHPVAKSAQIIDVNVDNMNALVGGLAAFSHRQTETESTDLNELVRKTIDFVRPQNRFDAIQFRFTPDPILPAVAVDPAQIQQVFINLLTNAADALTEVDVPVKKIFVETEYDAENQRVRIRFTDNGPGIPASELTRIFEPHYTTKVTGHGFGLATVFRIAANHRGSIRAATLPQGGAQFLFELPNA